LEGWVVRPAAATSATPTTLTLIITTLTTIIHHGGYRRVDVGCSRLLIDGCGGRRRDGGTEGQREEEAQRDGGTEGSVIWRKVGMDNMGGPTFRLAEAILTFTPTRIGLIGLGSRPELGVVGLRLISLVLFNHLGNGPAQWWAQVVGSVLGGRRVRVGQGGFVTRLRTAVLVRWCKVEVSKCSAPLSMRSRIVLDLIHMCMRPRA
jgi:hypothetical protein